MHAIFLMYNTIYVTNNLKLRQRLHITNDFRNFRVQIDSVYVLFFSIDWVTLECTTSHR